MNITSVMTIKGVSPQPAIGQWQVTSLVEAPPLRFFRRVVRLRFETGGMADRIRIDPENTSLEAVFRPYDYDALSPGEPSPKATLTSSGEAVIVTLDAPRQVRQVRLLPSVVSGSGYSVEFYRLDGNTPADKPTASVGVQSNMATLPSDVDFTDVRFAIRLKGPTGRPLRPSDLAGLQIHSYPTGPRLGISDPDKPDSVTFFWQSSGEVGKAVPADQGNVDAGKAFATALEGYLDDFFARLAEDTSSEQGFITSISGAVVLVGENPTDESGSAKGAFTVTDQTQIVRQQGGELVPAAFEDLQVGQLVSAGYVGVVAESYPTQGTAGSIVILDADESAHPPSPPPRFVEVALVMASDAPCILDIATFHVTYHLIRQSFPSREDKQVLRFPGDRATVQEVSVQLPGKTAIISATLETVESFRGDRPLASNDDHGAPDATPTQKKGVYVSVERWIAQGITPPQAMSVSGVAIALMAISSDTEVLVELQEDWHGQPSGKRLATGAISLEQVGRRSWATLLFPDATILPSSPHWILVKAAGGRALWLVDAGSTPARMLEGSNDSNAWSELSGFKGLQALHRLYSRGKQAQEQRPSSLTIGAHAAVTMSEHDGTKVYDLTSTFNDYLGSLPSSTPLTTIPLAFASALPGLITIYPPVIEYELGPV